MTLRSRQNRHNRHNRHIPRTTPRVRSRTPPPTPRAGPGIITRGSARCTPGTRALARRCGYALRALVCGSLTRAPWEGAQPRPACGGRTTASPSAALCECAAAGATGPAPARPTARRSPHTWGAAAAWRCTRGAAPFDSPSLPTRDTSSRHAGQHAGARRGWDTQEYGRAAFAIPPPCASAGLRLGCALFL